MVKELTQAFKDGQNVFVTDCAGLSVAQLGKLRESLKASKASYTVIKNSLGKLALKKTDANDLAPLLEGTIGIALGGRDLISVSRALFKFSKDTGKLKIKGAMLEGKLVNESEIKQISLLPSKEILLARAFGSMKAPISGFVTVLQGTLSKIVYAVNAIKEKKEKQV